MYKFDEKESHIKQDLLNKFPEWYKDLNKEDYYLVLTDDSDSLFSCKRLNTLFGLEIGGFYDFKSGLWLNEEFCTYVK